MKLVIIPRADTPMFGVSCWDNLKEEWVTAASKQAFVAAVPDAPVPTLLRQLLEKIVYCFPDEALEASLLKYLKGESTIFLPVWPP